MKQLPEFLCKKYQLPLGNRTYVMGILNYTPDSFSDGGLFNTPEQALKHVIEMQKTGIDILDLGANSTRPGAVILSEADELERLKEVLDILKGHLRIPLSVDTFYPACAEYALNHGADIINDVSGIIQPDLGRLTARFNAGLIVMHNPCGIHGADFQGCYPDGVVSHVNEFFIHCREAYMKTGIPAESLCYDPGIGFGKTPEENLELIRNIRLLKPDPECCLLCAASRKRLIGLASGEKNAARRDPGTVAIHTLAIAGGADIIRVHDAFSGIQGARTADAICRIPAKTGISGL